MPGQIEVTVQPGPQQPVGRLLILPGLRYDADQPLLAWSAQVAAEAGWRVSAVRWRADDVPPENRTSFVERAAGLLDDAAPAAPQTVVVAKSIGTRAASWANQRGYAGIWLTPLLVDPLVLDALVADGPAALSVGGTADQLWDPDAAARLRGEVVQVEGADHALQIAGDWRASMDALRLAMESVDRFLVTR